MLFTRSGNQNLSTRGRFFLLTIALFMTEVLIARYSTGGFIRGFVGDMLVILLMFCAVRSVLRLPVIPLALSVLFFAYLIEIGQWFGLVDKLGLGQYRLARIIIGSHFDWLDWVAYSVGFVIICLIHHYQRSNLGDWHTETGN
ncbi:MAG: DUF2809 domain-containing protein [Plesiomonas sp.]